jgi:hypothetical protein
MSSKFQKYSSIKEEVYETFIQLIPGFSFSIIIGLFLTFLVSTKDSLFRNYRNILCENLALDSIYLFFFFALIAWGAYFAALSIIPGIYRRVKEDTMLGISRYFIAYASVSLGILAGFWLSLTIFKLLSLLKFIKPNLTEKICEIKYDKPHLYYYLISITLCFFVIFIPYYYILKPINDSKIKYSDSMNYHQTNLYRFKPRLILFFAGVFIFYISVKVLQHTTLNVKN